MLCTLSRSTGYVDYGLVKTIFMFDKFRTFIYYAIEQSRKDSICGHIIFDSDRTIFVYQFPVFY